VFWFRIALLIIVLILAALIGTFGNR
jgi:hypothetical protein